MIWKIARYTVREGEIEPVLAAVERFVAAVGENEPGTLYRAWRDEAEPLRFVHLMAFPDRDAEERHRGSEHTGAFVEVLYPRCSVRPVFRDLAPIGPEGWG